MEAALALLPVAVVGLVAVTKVVDQVVPGGVGLRRAVVPAGQGVRQARVGVRVVAED